MENKLEFFSRRDVGGINEDVFQEALQKAKEELKNKPLDLEEIKKRQEALRNAPKQKTLVNLKYDRYFTPEISDIRVGYECEIRRIQPSEMKGSFNKEQLLKVLLEKPFESYTISKPDFQMLWFSGLEDVVRVPYLTKEQIEAEGWVVDSQVHMLTGVAYRKNDFELEHIGRSIKVWKPNHFGVFAGECKDINTFRYICKLLKIN